MQAGIIGASGYLGTELLRLLASHPDLEVVSAQSASSAGQAIGAIAPGLSAAYPTTRLGSVDPAALCGCDVVFVAVPSGKSQPIVGELIDTVGTVVDLGADFRLKDAQAYELWYGFHHAEPQLLERAVFGLPELFRAALPGAALVAAPGCYVTAAALALAPLLAAQAIDPVPVIVDAASGTSGAGRVPGAGTHHAFVNENFTAYGVTTHRHTPEIEQVTGAKVLFTPHMAPMTCGILATCYARCSKESSTAELLEVLEAAYRGEPFVRVGEALPSTREVYGTNVASLSARFDRRTGYAVIISAIDNITKGGAGQALQAANVALGLDERLGLPTVAFVP